MHASWLTLYSVDSGPRTRGPRNPKRRSVHVQLQMSFLETPPPPKPTPVWATLDGQQRAAVVVALARLIAKVAATLNEALVNNEEANND